MAKFDLDTSDPKPFEVEEGLKLLEQGKPVKKKKPAKKRQPALQGTCNECSKKGRKTCPNPNDPGMISCNAFRKSKKKKEVDNVQ